MASAREVLQYDRAKSEKISELVNPLSVWPRQRLSFLSIGIGSVIFTEPLLPRLGMTPAYCVGVIAFVRQVAAAVSGDQRWACHPSAIFSRLKWPVPIK
jgi:hypothetical protein